MLVDRPPTMEQVLAHESQRLANLPPPVVKVEALSPHQLAADQARYQRQKLAEEHRAEYVAAVRLYEDHIPQLKAILHRLWDSAQQYHNLTGQPLPTFEMNKVLSIHIPSLVALNELDSGFTTTRVSAMAYQDSLGKRW